MGQTTRILTNEAVLVAAAVSVITAIGIYWYQRKKKSDNKVPCVWRPVAKVKNLYIYPLKSGHRIELQKAICTKFGVKMPKSGDLFQFHDRNLLVYKEEFNEFQTARQHPKMIFIKAVPYDEDHFTLDAPGMEILVVKIPSAAAGSRINQITLHKGEKIPTTDCGNEAAHWISKYILNSESGLRLGFHEGLSRRNIEETHKQYLEVHSMLSNEATGMYSDLSSYLVVNQASVNDLSNKISSDNVTALNFRPNILIEGENAGPYAEDNWKWIKIGDVILYAARPCTRCIFTTINPINAIKSSNNEPLRTLRTYRQLKTLKNIDLDGSLTVMGVNMGLAQEGEISVGDVVYVG